MSLHRCIALPLFALASLLLFGACAGSQGQQESSSEVTESEQSSTSGSQQSSGDDSEASDSESSRNSDSSRNTIELASLIGVETADGLPGGCPNEWQKLEGRDYNGTMYACEGFAVRDPYKQPTVMIGVRDHVVRRINLQVFYESGEPVRRAYRTVTERYQTDCKSQGAGGDSMTFRCDGYLVQVSHRERAGSMRVILGLKTWDLPK